MTERTDIDGFMEVMKASFPNFHPGLGTPEIYMQLLGDLDRDELRAAVLSCCSEPGRAFAPSIGEIRGAVMELRRQARGVPSPLEAWSMVKKSLGTNERCHPLVQKVIDLFGYWYLKQSEDEMADRAHFLKEYERMMKDEMFKDVQLPQVTAYVESKKMKLLELNASLEESELASGWMLGADGAQHYRPKLESHDPPEPGEFTPMPPEIRERLDVFIAKKKIP